MERKLMPKQREHYQFNMGLLQPILYMELRGIAYDKKEADKRLAQTQRNIYRMQHLLNRAAGRTLPNSEAEWVNALRLEFCRARPTRKRTVETLVTSKNGKTKVTSKTLSEAATIQTLADVQEFVLPSHSNRLHGVLRLARKSHLSHSERGKLSEQLGLNLKVGSTGAGGDAQWFLYEHCAFPKQFKKIGNKLSDKLATDDEALLKIWVGQQRLGAKQLPPLQEGPRLKNRARLALAFLKLRRLITASKSLEATPDADGRIRCSYNLVGSKTHRFSCSESPTGSGFNLQTVTKKQRDLFRAEPGCLIAQKDGSGADGWTVAAYSAMLRDRAMLDDYKAGLKPAKIGVLLWQTGPAINKLSREELREICKTINPESWQYFAFKRVQHGRSYGMGDQTQSDQILTDSYKLSGKPIHVNAATCKDMAEKGFFPRYWGVQKWHSWMEAHIRQYGELTASNGFRRVFFGPRLEHATVKEALAHLPQVYTTAATTMALHKMWNDPENREADGATLKCEPLHTVHDSLIYQFQEANKAWAIAKSKEWFCNPQLIAGEMITIPFEGAMGRDWKHLNEGTI
jgi:hypothetical protein